MKKLVVTSLLTLALVFGFGEAAFAHTPRTKACHSCSYKKGFRATPKSFTPNVYHRYWTGGTKNRIHGK